MLTLEEPASTNAIQIIPCAERYAQQLENLTAKVYQLDPREDDCTLNAAHFRHHLSIFPEGQFIAVDTATDTVVGLTVSMRMPFDPQKPMLTSWWESIGYGWLTTHAPRGEWLYGVESAVHPDYQGKGIGKQLTNARLGIMRSLNLRGMIAGSAIISYHKVADSVPVEQYVADVIAGRRFDNNLSKQIKMGFKPLHIIPNYLPDTDCVGYGVEMMIENPAYQPPHNGWPHNRPQMTIQPSLG